MNTYKRILCFLMVLILSGALTACGDLSADYPDASSFEAALNNGENLEGKTVQFTAIDVIPNSVLFWSTENKDVYKDFFYHLQ